jgi:linoleate 10R-lipoxygenase
MSQLPANSPIGSELANTAVGLLYNSIPHPPAAYLGPEYTFRHADGGMNNIHRPDLGRAGTRYARSVQPKNCIHPSSLPDPGLIFDTLLRARDVRCVFYSLHTRLDVHGLRSVLITRAETRVWPLLSRLS